MKKIQVLVLSLFTLFGCGYSLHGRASLPFEALQIGNIENKTREPKLDDRLHRVLAEELLKQGFRVDPQAGYTLSGTINKFDMHILSESSDIATEYEVVVNGDFTLTDPSGNIRQVKNIGSPFIISFSSAGPLEELVAFKEVASERAVRDIAMEILASLLFTDSHESGAKPVLTGH
ncbi:MAG: LptE family protein [Nitrospirota bacterium]